MTIRILEPGLYTLPVDLGRPRTRSLGVPLGGAADRTSLMLGNSLVGNPARCGGPGNHARQGRPCKRFRMLAGVIFGAPLRCPDRRPNPPAGATFTLRTNEVLGIGGVDG